MTLNFLMYRRNERKKEGEENRGTHPRVSLFHSHRPTLLYPFLSSLYLCFSRPNVCLFFFFFLSFSLFSLFRRIKNLRDDDSLPRYYYTPISLMIDTLNLSSWRTGDVAFNYLFPLFLFLFLYSFLSFCVCVCMFFFFFKRS